MPVGPEGGTGQVAGNADLVSAAEVAQSKGRDMLVQRYVELLGADPGSER